MYTIHSTEPKEPFYRRLLYTLGLLKKHSYTPLSFNQGVLEHVVADTPLIVSVKDTEGKYVVVSDAFCDLFGISIDEIVGKTDVDLKLFLNPESILESDSEVLKNGKKQFFPLEPITDKYGSLFWFETTKVPVKNENGEFANLVTYSRDITTKVKTNQELTKSEIRYKSIYENNYSGIIVVNKYLLIKRKNKAFNTMVGANRRIEATDDLKRYLNDEDKQDLQDLMLGLISRNYEFFDFRLDLRLTQGDVIYTNCFVRGLYTETDEFTEAIVTFQDISKELEHLHEIEESENRFRTIVENATEAILILDYDQRKYIDCNRNAIKLFGYDSNELRQLQLGQLSPLNQSTGENSASLSLSYFDQALKGHELAYEWIIQRKDGKMVPCEVRLVKLPYKDRNILRISVIDITARKKAEHLLNSEKRKLQETNEELVTLNHQLAEQTSQLQEFAYISSHNLRSPAGNIRSLIDFYQKQPSDVNLDLFIDKLDIVSTDLLETIGDLSEVVKIKNEKVKQEQMVDLETLVDKTKSTLSEELDKTDATIKTDFTQISQIMASKTYLESIFLNLISNAIKYRRDNENPIIEIKTSISNESITLTFADNGLGIDLQKFGSKVFGLRKTFHRHKDSRGVGLFLTKAQVEAMGGRIFVDSVVEKGSTFTIELPLSKVVE